MIERVCSFLVVSSGKPSARSKRICQPKTDSVPVPVRSVLGWPCSSTWRIRSRYGCMGARLPTRRKKPVPRPLARIRLHGARDAGGFAEIAAVAEANILARSLTALPPNELTPAEYRRRLQDIARSRRWQFEEFDMRRLRRLGAGAFVAVAQGSAPEDAAIVHLSWRPKKPQGRLALVGKGICFDTGGHNLKPAKYMAGMHEDMNGSAVALA
jgi:leucyl aminopeptidase